MACRCNHLYFPTVHFRPKPTSTSGFRVSVSVSTFRHDNNTTMSAAVRAPSHPGRHDIPAITGLTLLTSAAYYGIQELLWRVVEPFDSSHLINTTATSPGLRWDALHFLAIATGGYTHEQQVAFQPGWQGLLHVLGMGAGNGGDDAILRAAVIVNTLMRMLANVYLYKCAYTQRELTLG